MSPCVPTSEEGGRPDGSRERAHADLARTLGLDPPPFDGPLVAFDMLPGRAPNDPVCLGGDLHAVHPDAALDPPLPHDPTLDQATVILADLETQTREITAAAGIWCMTIEGAPLDSAPYLTIYDTDGRLRARRLLPPPRLMVRIGHFWLPSIPPFAADDRPW